MSDAPAAGDAPAAAPIMGRVVQLPGGRSVGLYEGPAGVMLLRFKNGERMTEVVLSPEALDAVVMLALERPLA